MARLPVLFPNPGIDPAAGLQRKKGLEPTTGIEPVNLFLTKEALYLLSYVGLHPSVKD